MSCHFQTSQETSLHGIANMLYMHDIESLPSQSQERNDQTFRRHHGAFISAQATVTGVGA